MTNNLHYVPVIAKYHINIFSPTLQMKILLHSILNLCIVFYKRFCLSHLCQMRKKSLYSCVRNHCTRKKHGSCLSLQWRHNGCDASLITSLTIFYPTAYSGADQRNHQSSASLAFVRTIHRWPGSSPHNWSVTREMLPFDDVIMRKCKYKLLKST